MPIYQEKDKSKIPKNGNSWYFRDYYTNIYGERKQKQSKMFPTKNVAKDEETKFLNKIMYSDENDSNIKFSIVYNEYLEFKKRKVKSTTYYRLNITLNKYILSFFSDYKLHSIKSNVINTWYQNFENEKISIKYKNSLIGYLKEIFTYARDNYKFDPKVLSKIQPLPDEIYNIVKKDAELNYWTYDDFQKFIKIVDNPIYYNIFNFLYFTGVRKGEMFALNWNDIDFVNNKLTINKTCSAKTGSGKYQILTPKTNNSVRVIDLDDRLIALLKNHYNSEKNIYNFNNKMFVFGNVKPISSTTLARNLNKYIELANVKKISPHGFRHSHVSLLIDLGCDSRDVAKRIGDTVQVVEKTYYHMFPNKQSKSVNLINKLTKQEVIER